MRRYLSFLRKILPSSLFFPLPRFVLTAVLVVFCSALLSSCLGQPQPNTDNWTVDLTCNNGPQITQCHVTLMTSPRSQHWFRWQFVSSSPAGAVFSPDSGTLKLGEKSQDVLVTFAPSAACPVTLYLTMTPLMVGSENATAGPQRPQALSIHCP